MAKYIGYITDPNYDDSNRKQSNGARCPYFRRTFFVNKPVKRVTVNVAAYGIFRAYINGTLVSEEVFASGWSDYHYTVYYRMYDVTSLVKEGVNAFGAIVGDGWYASNLSDVGRFVFGGYPLKLRYEVDVTYEDGTEQTIGISSFGETRAFDVKATVTKIVVCMQNPSDGSDYWQELGCFVIEK